MNKIKQKTPMEINYRILDFIEQVADEVAPKGTTLGLSDLISALCSGYFIESGGAVMPAVEAFLRQAVPDEAERAARSRRAAKALTYGSYNIHEVVTTVRRRITETEAWQPIKVQGYRVMAVDITAYKRLGVKKLTQKAYDAEIGRAVKGVPVGLLAEVGVVGDQRMAVLNDVVTTGLSHTKKGQLKEGVYQRVAKRLAADELGVMDAGFRLVESVAAGIDACLIRLAKNSVFGATPGRIPPRTSAKGPTPTQYQAEIVRPLARQHGEKVLEATPADEIVTLHDEQGQEIEVHIWSKVYFLERQLNKVTDEAKKAALRERPLKVMAIYHPAYENPLLVGTPLITLEPEAAYQGYTHRWPVEGLPQTGKYILSGGGGTHYVHHPTAMQRLPILSLVFGSLLKYVAATSPPLRTGFWDRAAKPTYGRLVKHLKKVGIPLSSQLSKKASTTAHLPVGYEAIRLFKAKLRQHDA